MEIGSNADRSARLSEAEDRRRQEVDRRMDLLADSPRLLFEHNFEKEELTMADVRSMGDGFIRDRQAAVDYLRTNCPRHGKTGFGLYIPHMAITLFDRFCLKSQIPQLVEDANDNVILLVVDCLKLSWELKRSESETLPPLPHEFPAMYVEQLVEEIHKHLELVKPVQPFDYTLYFSQFLNSPPPTLVDDLDLLLARFQEDVESTSVRPSVVAGVGLLVVISKRLPSQAEEFRLSVLESEWFSPFQEMIQTCRGKMELLYASLFDETTDTTTAPPPPPGSLNFMGVRCSCCPNCCIQ